MDDLSTVRSPKDTRARSAARTRLCLALVASPVAEAVGQLLPLGSSPTLILRVGVGAEMDEEMSRRHATVQRRDDRLWVRDGREKDGEWVGSANGSFGPSGERIGADGAMLRRGDAFRTGRSLWVVVEVGTGVADEGDSLLKGFSPAMAQVREQVGMVAALVAGRLERRERVHQSLLVLGPRGSGKQVVAKEAHRLVQLRLGRNVPFRQVAAPVLDDGTAGADLFGVVAGYATQTAARAGYFEQADGGVLLLDEVGDMPPAAQARLLNVLQERSVTRMGGSKAVPFDCLVVSATNKDVMPEAGAEGPLRSDLVDRLARFVVTLPPLRERPEDIPPIAAALMRRHGFGGPIEADLMHALMTRWWRGNVRELDSVLEQVCALAEFRGEEPSAALLQTVTRNDPAASDEPDQPPITRSKRGRPDRDELVAVLETNDWNKAEVARLYGRDPRQVRRWIAHYELESGENEDV